MITWSTVSAWADVCIWRHFGDQANNDTNLVHGRQLLSRPYTSPFAGAETLAIFDNYLRPHRLDNTPRKQHNLWRKRSSKFWTANYSDATLCILRTSVCRLVNKMYAMQTSLQHWLQIPIFMNLVCYNSKKNDDTGNSIELNSVFALFTQKLWSWHIIWDLDTSLCPSGVAIGGCQSSHTSSQSRFLIILRESHYQELH